MTIPETGVGTRVIAWSYDQAIILYPDHQPPTVRIKYNNFTYVPKFHGLAWNTDKTRIGLWIRMHNSLPGGEIELFLELEGLGKRLIVKYDSGFIQRKEYSNLL